jgi:PAT family beta-lactamase induction signal transducer AmpG
MTSHSATHERHVHPWIFMILILPFGVIDGYLQTTLGYLLSQQHVPVSATAGLITLGFLPHTWKFFWAPIADTTLSRKTWYAIGAVLTSAGILVMGLLPTTAAGLKLLGIAAFVANLAVTFLGMSVESLMAYATPEDEKGRAGGWFQAGNLGGTGVGGGLGLILAQRLAAPWMAGAVLAAACLLCLVALAFVPDSSAGGRHPSLAKSLAEVVRDVWKVARARLGAIALILCFLPIGSGAASGLWAAVAGDWHASANTVALATGVITGLVSAVGCLSGGWISDRMNRKGAYVLYGVLQALCAAGMALAPRNELNFIVFTILYAFITGLTYAGFTAFVLEAMGLGAAATKYNLFASLSNIPIAYMTTIDGKAHDRWGSAGLLYAECVFCALGLLVFAIVLALWRQRGRASAGAIAGAPADLSAAEIAE